MWSQGFVLWSPRCDSEAVKGAGVLEWQECAFLTYLTTIRPPGREEKSVANNPGWGEYQTALSVPPLSQQCFCPSLIDGLGCPSLAPAHQPAFPDAPQAPEMLVPHMEFPIDKSLSRRARGLVNTKGGASFMLSITFDFVNMNNILISEQLGFAPNHSPA